LLALLRHSNRLGECPVIRVERKCPGTGRNDAIDPFETLNLIRTNLPSRQMILIGIGDRCNADRDGLGRDGRGSRDDIGRGSFKWRDVDRRDRCADLFVDLFVDLFLGVLQLIRPGLRLEALLSAGLLPPSCLRWIRGCALFLA
jgi:hypothetical protein